MKSIIGFIEVISNISMKFIKREFPLIYQNLQIDKIEIKKSSKQANARIVRDSSKLFHIKRITIYMNGCPPDELKNRLINELAHEMAHIIYWRHTPYHEWLTKQLRDEINSKLSSL